MQTLNQKIETLKAGESVIISKTAFGYCQVERSGNGKIIRFVRFLNNGSFEVFKTCTK